MDCWPPRETCSVQFSPSQYRISNRPEGSAYQPEGTAGAGEGSTTEADGVGEGDTAGDGLTAEFVAGVVDAGSGLREALVVAVAVAPNAFDPLGRHR